jgi:hypothetical protein
VNADQSPPKRTFVSDRGAVLSRAESGTILWSWLYRDGMLVTPGRVAAGVKAMKLALIANGFHGGIDPDLPVWGTAVEHQTIAFQQLHGELPEGQLHLRRRILGGRGLRLQRRRRAREAVGRGRQARLRRSDDRGRRIRRGRLGALHRVRRARRRL